MSYTTKQEFNDLIYEIVRAAIPVHKPTILLFSICGSLRFQLHKLVRPVLLLVLRITRIIRAGDNNRNDFNLHAALVTGGSKIALEARFHIVGAGTAQLLVVFKSLCRNV